MNAMHIVQAVLTAGFAIAAYVLCEQARRNRIRAEAAATRAKTAADRAAAAALRATAAAEEAFARRVTITADNDLKD